MTGWPLSGAAVFAALVLTLTPPALAADSEAAHHDAHVSLDPTTGAIQVHNTITVQAESRVRVRLDPAFVVETLKVDGLRRSPDRHGDKLSIDVGSMGVHTISLSTRANLAGKIEHQYPPFLGPEGGFLAMGWLGHPEGRTATYVVKVTTPLPTIAVLPGRLESEIRKDGTYTATYASTIPDSPPVLISGPFTVMEKMAGDVRIRTDFHDELAPLADGYLQDTARYIDHYAKAIGPYPYSGFAIVSGPAPVGFGLPGMTYMGRKVLALPFIRATSLPHEVLHNWWGNAVGVDYATGNWAEGLTSYQADHAQAASQAQDGGRGKRQEWLRNFAALPPARDTPVTAFQSKTHDATQVVGYDKVAFIFHMLKTRLGDAVFNASIQRFYADNLHRIAGWVQVRAAFEAESGEDLGAFFEAWLNRTGAPQLKLEDVQAQGPRLTFTLTQTQDGAAYPLTLDAVVTTTAGDQGLHLEMTQKSQRYTVVTDAPPVTLTVDRELNVFRRLDPSETPPIFRDVTLNANTHLIAPGDDIEIHREVRALAEGLMQTTVADANARTDLALEGPFIVAGLTRDVMAFLSERGLPHPPASLDPTAQALAYVVREDGGRTLLVAMARDKDSLALLARALPHYKRYSFTVMTNDHVSDKGAWPAGQGPLMARLD